MKKISLFLSLFTVISFPALSQICKPESIIPSHVVGQYLDSNDGTITDVVNELMWSRCSLAVGQNFVDNDCTEQTHFASWDEALQAVRDFNADNGSAFTNWRLPNIKELGSLVERSCYDPAIDQEYFPSTPSEPYWSNTFNSMDIYNKSDIEGLLIDFKNGSGVINETGNRLIRLVRDMPSQ
jgi:hypothetical protein